MKTFRWIAAGLVLLLIASVAMAETDSTTQTVGLAVNEVAEIAAAGSVGDLIIDNPAKGGQEPAAVSSASAYLQYTSIVPELSPGVLKTRQIEAQVTGGTIPAGTTLTLHAEVATGEPAVGQVGSRIGTDEKDLGIKVLDAYPSRPIVGGITSGWTGTDDGAGARLFYTFRVYDWSAVKIAPRRSITVTYTLMDPAP